MHPPLEQSQPTIFNASNINFTHITHICHTPIVGFDNGTLNVAPDFIEPELILKGGPPPSSHFRCVTSRFTAHAHGVKVLVTVGAYSKRLWANATATRVFAENVATHDPILFHI